MQGFKHVVLGTAAAAVIACAPVASAGAHGLGHLHSWGLGRGLLGTVFGLATLPIAIASAALSAAEPEAPAQSPSGYDGQRGYAPPPAYYAVPQSYYAPLQVRYAPPQPYGSPRTYYPRATVYYSPAPRADYVPHAYYAPRQIYYGGHASYRAGGYAYSRR